MKKIFKITLFIVVCLLILQWVIFFHQQGKYPVLDPKGWVALQQRDLIVISVILMLLIVIPTIFLIFYFSWKYREGNKKTKYTPDWDHSYLAEVIWWGIPCIIVAILSVITWKSSHQLDPYKPLDHPGKPLTIQAIALRWKWLFIYPEEQIATVNFIQFPEKRPITFEITADAPMNSFWIPQLGGQIYAMPGMKTKIHLIANETGVFRGSSANLSGQGFAGMKFQAKASSEEEFLQWVKKVQQSNLSLTQASYEEIAKPSEYNPVALYVLKAPDLFESIAMKPMMEKH